MVTADKNKKSTSGENSSANKVIIMKT